MKGITRMAETDFSKLPLRPELRENLETLGFLQMTPIQAHTLPLILAGEEIVAQSETGTGKTAAFGLGLLQSLKPKLFSTQALVLCPTRELSNQVADTLRVLVRRIPNIKILSLTGGTPLGPQIRSLQHPPHVVVGTPGRLEDLLRKSKLSLSTANYVVIDEADKMLEMGFAEPVIRILEKTPKERQTLLFSATFPQRVQDLVNHVARTPKHITVKPNLHTNVIEQSVYPVRTATQRPQCLIDLLLCVQPKSTLVFCNTKNVCRRLAQSLVEQGFHALDLHGDMEQKARNETLLLFANQSISVLIATDVAARGIDVQNIDLVVNYHPAMNLEAHTHRIGRTGRAGQSGIAVTLLLEAERQHFDDYTKNEWGIIPPFSTHQRPRARVSEFAPAKRTIVLKAGKQQKLRKGDILGALTRSDHVAASDVGQIEIFWNESFVAVSREIAQRALVQLRDNPIKGRQVRVAYCKREPSANATS